MALDEITVGIFTKTACLYMYHEKNNESRLKYVVGEHKYLVSAEHEAMKTTATE